jgi:hypothetical protein
MPLRASCLVAALLHASDDVSCYRSLMHHTQADIEAALLQIMHAEERIEEQRTRIARMRRQQQSTELAEDLLGVLLQCRELVQKHLGRLTSPSLPGNVVTLSKE